MQERIEQQGNQSMNAPPYKLLQCLHC